MNYDDTYENLEWFVNHYEILEGYDISKISDKEVLDDICYAICDAWQVLDKGPLMDPDAVADYVSALA
jgi:hypothetical protein